MLEQMNSSLFDWLAWRNGTILELLNISQRKCSIIANKHTLRKHAIGWATAESVPCRPKKGYMAVMFCVGERQFWTHLTNEEFGIVFG